MKEEAQSVASTTDIQTSVADEPYMSVTAHCIDLNWVMQAFALETFAFLERYTGVNIAETIFK